MKQDPTLEIFAAPPPQPPAPQQPPVPGIDQEAKLVWRLKFVASKIPRLSLALFLLPFACSRINIPVNTGFKPLLNPFPRDRTSVRIAARGALFYAFVAGDRNFFAIETLPTHFFTSF